MSRWHAARAWWSALALREQQLLVLMAAVVLAAFVWFVALAPALRTVRGAPAQIQALDVQWQAMQALAAQARSLQGRPALSREEALRELELSVRQRLGASAQVNTTADQATVALKGAAPQAMSQWLSQARLKARVVATQASLTRSAEGWEGTVVFSLPPTP